MLTTPKQPHPWPPPRQLPKLTPPPPFEEGWKLQDGLPVTRPLYDTLSLMIATMNAGIDVARQELRWGAS